MSRLAVLRAKLGRLQRHRAVFRQTSAWCAVLAAAAIALMGVFLLDVTFDLRLFQRVLVIGCGVASVLWSLRRFSLPIWRVRESELDVALLVERHYGIRSDLVAALQFERPDAAQWGSAELRTAVIEGTRRLGQHMNVVVDDDDHSLRQRLWIVGAACVLALLVFGIRPAHTAVFLNRLLLGSQHYPTRTVIESLAVNGQTLDVPRPEAVGVPIGDNVRFVVRCSGDIPEQGRLEVRSPNGDQQTNVVLGKVASSDQTGSEFTGTLPRLLDPALYQVFLGDAWTDSARLEVIPAPSVDVKLRITPPEYAQHAASQLNTNSLQCTVVAGSQVGLSVEGTNKPLKDVQLTIQDDPDRPLPLSPTDETGRRWALTTENTPFHRVDRPLKFELQVTDTDGLHPLTTPRGSIRLRPDRPPRIAASVIHKIVLPTAKPMIEYIATDDYGIGRVQLQIEVHRQQTKKQERVVSIREPGSRVTPERLPLRGRYRLDLSGFDLREGDRVTITPQVIDDRGSLAGQTASGEPFQLEVSDEGGVLAAISSADQLSEKQLTEIINRQVGIGDQE